MAVHIVGYDTRVSVRRSEVQHYVESLPPWWKDLLQVSHPPTPEEAREHELLVCGHCFGCGYRDGACSRCYGHGVVNTSGNPFRSMADWRLHRDAPPKLPVPGPGRKRVE